MLKPYYDSNLVEAGCDEAGRGCLAGPVFAAAVILPKSFSHPLLNDSKKMKAGERDDLRVIIENEALTWAVAKIDVVEIDSINILNASFKAMHLAISELTTNPDILLIDGNRFKPFRNYKHRCIVGGDGIYQSIAAASVLAKTHRDEYMTALHAEFPDYGWDKNKAYGTAQHIKAIRQLGLTVYHRKSFVLKSNQLELF